MPEIAWANSLQLAAKILLADNLLLATIKSKATEILSLLIWLSFLFVLVGLTVPPCEPYEQKKKQERENKRQGREKERLKGKPWSAVDWWLASAVCAVPRRHLHTERALLFDYGLRICEQLFSSSSSPALLARPRCNSMEDDTGQSCGTAALEKWAAGIERMTGKTSRTAKRPWREA